MGWGIIRTRVTHCVSPHVLITTQNRLVIFMFNTKPINFILLIQSTLEESITKMNNEKNMVDLFISLFFD